MYISTYKGTAAPGPLCLSENARANCKVQSRFSREVPGPMAPCRDVTDISSASVTRSEARTRPSLAQVPICTYKAVRV